MTIDDTQRSLQAEISQILGWPPDRVHPETTLSRLGLDSLGMLHLIEHIEHGLGRDVEGPSSVEHLTIAELARMLAAERPMRQARADRELDRMLADSTLPGDIRPLCPASSQAPQTILLTGATGFLGAFLLASLLERSTAEVVAMVRPSRTDALVRVRENLSRYGIWKSCYEGRIQCIEADLSQPRLGLAPADFRDLAGVVDAIVHAGASVNWIQPYAGLRGPNVLGVRELLRFATAGKTKRFHFVSSLAVCYSTRTPGEALETAGSGNLPGDLLDDLRGLHLGYAQTKRVAEHLVWTAAGRGLPVRIYRPSLISGDSASGLSNTDDFLSVFIQGCVAMGAAPDLDWRLDALPVDFVADAIVQLALDSAAPDVLHLANPRPRHWRELILWMNLYGYPVALCPYEEWLARLDQEIRSSGNPLRDLMPFFRRRPETGQEFYLPQLYEETRRRPAQFERSCAAILARGLAFPELSTRLLDRYFDSFARRQFLPHIARPLAASPSLKFDAEFFGAAIGRPVRNVRPCEWRGGHSVIGELTSWKSGQPASFGAYRLDTEDAPLDVVVKIRHGDDTVLEVGTALAALCSEDLGRAYSRFWRCLGISGCGARELAVYGQSDPRFRRYTPAFHGSHAGGGMAVLVLENLSGLELMSSADDIGGWRPAHIEAAIDGLAELHAVWLGREDELRRQSWLGDIPSSAAFAEAAPLWRALAEHARPIFDVPAWMVASVEDSWRQIEDMPRTLIHHDFNPRNLAFRRDSGRLRLCVYDWELATLGLPQRDLAELLCFVLKPDAELHELSHYVEQHRRALERASGACIDSALWRRGFQLSLYDLGVHRLPAYAMIHRFQRQRFLDRVTQTWRRVVETFH